MAPPCLDAVTKARDALFKKIAPAVKAAAEDLSLKDGQLCVKGEPMMAWKDACRKLGMMPITETGKFAEGLSSVGVGGCQFAEVTVDIETGVVRVKKIVAIQDSGLIIDKLTWESQVYGGVIMRPELRPVRGAGHGPDDGRDAQPRHGAVQARRRLATSPRSSSRPTSPTSMKARGVIGVGEPPTIATAAAIGNAVTNAIGVRVPEWPMSPRNVLNALATASKEGKA